MKFTIEQLQYCSSLAGEALLAAPLDDGDELASITKLRKICPPDIASAVWALRQIRTKSAASGKFPHHFADRLLADETMIQQSSSMRAAIYAGAILAKLATSGNGNAKAENIRPIYDLCCGMGINSLAAAVNISSSRASHAEKPAITGVDISEGAVFCARHNAKLAGVAEMCSFICGDVTQIDIPADAVIFIDPDRRSGARRSILPADHSPGEDFIRSLIERFPSGGVIKLSPACSAAALADWPLSWQYIGESGRCRQLLGVWGPSEITGKTQSIAATVLFGDIERPQSLTISAGTGDKAEVDPQPAPGSGVMLCQRAVSAAAAVDSLAATLERKLERPVKRASAEADVLICPGLIEAGSRLSAEVLEVLTGYSPAASCFELLASCRGDTKDIAATIEPFGAAQLEVLTRGLSADTDAMQKKLSTGGASQRLSVILYASGKSRRALIARRLAI